MTEQQFLEQLKTLRANTLENGGVLNFVRSLDVEISDNEIQKLSELRDDIDAKLAKVAHLSYLTEPIHNIRDLLENLEEHLQYFEKIEYVEEAINKYPELFEHVNEHNALHGSSLFMTLVHFQALCDAIEIVHNNRAYDIEANFFGYDELSGVILNPVEYSWN